MPFELRIGKFIISEALDIHDPDKICIRKLDGEGGDFDKVEFLKVIEDTIRKFYEENF